MNQDVVRGPPLPSDVFDLIVDQLDDKPDQLRACCLVSRSWVPRTRKHLFASVTFDTSQSSIRRWKEIFPDPSTAPAQYTRSVVCFGLTPVIAESMLAWTHSFRRLVELQLWTSALDNDQVSLIQLSGLSPTLRSLRLHIRYLPRSEILSLICSFPLLEDLYLHHVSRKTDDETWKTPPNSPKLTGTLQLTGCNFSIACGLLAFPNGLNFSQVSLVLPVRDAQFIMALIPKCSETLESLTVGYAGAFSLVPAVDKRVEAFGCP